MKVTGEKVKIRQNVMKIALIVAVIIVLGLCAFKIASNAADISRKRAELNEKQTVLDEQLAENDRIKEILESDDKSEYMEQEARKKGYTKDGEIIYYDSSSGN